MINMINMINIFVREINDRAFFLILVFSFEKNLMESHYFCQFFLNLDEQRHGE